MVKGVFEWWLRGGGAVVEGWSRGGQRVWSRGARGCVHLELWRNNHELFSDIPKDLGNTKWFKFKNTTENDLLKIYYWGKLFQ